MDGAAGVSVGSFSSGVGVAGYDSTGTADVDVADLQVLQNVVIVEPIREETTKSGLVIADVGDAQKVRFGTVRAVGPGRFEEGVYVPTALKVGDCVMFGRYQSAGEPIKMNGREYLMFREGDIAARVKAS
jgi:chaperonin GroES